MALITALSVGAVGLMLLLTLVVYAIYPQREVKAPPGDDPIEFELGTEVRIGHE